MDSTYALIDKATGVVANIIVWDGSDQWAPPDDYLAVRTEVAGVGWTYADGVFVSPPVPPTPPLTPEQVLTSNTERRDQLLAAAGLAIAPLQDALDLDDITPSEAALLKQWKQFRVAVNRVDLTSPSPSWPTAPQAGWGASLVAGDASTSA